MLRNCDPPGLGDVDTVKLASRDLLEGRGAIAQSGGQPDDAEARPLGQHLLGVEHDGW